VLRLSSTKRSNHTRGDKVTVSKKSIFRLLLSVTLSLSAASVLAHGDVVPQAVDTTALKQIGAEWVKANPYRGNKDAIRIGDSAFNQNCARCHGLGAISGGVAPDLRYLPAGDEGDEVFMPRVRRGATRDGRVYMPPFEGILSQEAMWALRSWLETVREE
jgi:cytochrome c-550 PedF